MSRCHEVAASDLDITHIVSPIRALLRRTRVVCGDVIGIDFETRHVEVRHGLTQHQHVLMYDQLVLALGSITNFYNLPGLQSHSLTMAPPVIPATNATNVTATCLHDERRECRRHAYNRLPATHSANAVKGPSRP